MSVKNSIKHIIDCFTVYANSQPVIETSFYYENGKYFREDIALNGMFTCQAQNRYEVTKEAVQSFIDIETLDSDDVAACKALGFEVE